MRRLAALGLTLAAVGAAGVAPASAVEGSAQLPGPGGCDPEVFWNTNEDPMAGANVPHYSNCVKAVTDALGGPGH